MNSLPSGTKASVVLGRAVSSNTKYLLLPVCSSTEKLREENACFDPTTIAVPLQACLRHASVWSADRSPADRSPTDGSPTVRIVIFKTRTLLSLVNPFNNQYIGEIDHGFYPLTDKRRAPQAGRALG